MYYYKFFKILYDKITYRNTTFIFKAKKISKNAFRSLKLGAKMEIRGGKSWGWKQKI
jgi:hypothetical protein